MHVGTIAAKAQTTNTHTEGFGELDLMDMPCPFQLFYSDGVEQLGAELASRERVHWVIAIWYVSLVSIILLAHDVFTRRFSIALSQCPIALRCSHSDSL